MVRGLLIIFINEPLTFIFLIFRRTPSSGAGKGTLEFFQGRGRALLNFFKGGMRGCRTPLFKGGEGHS
jgi:hypothetical protein